jgi:hypothetical protein
MAKPVQDMTRAELVDEVLSLRLTIERMRTEAADEWVAVGEGFVDRIVSHDEARARAAALYRDASVVEPWPDDETYDGSVASKITFDRPGFYEVHGPLLPKRVPGKALDEAQQANPAPEQVGTADDDLPDA